MFETYTNHTQQHGNRKQRPPKDGNSSSNNGIAMQEHRESGGLTVRTMTRSTSYQRTRVVAASVVVSIVPVNIVVTATSGVAASVVVVGVPASVVVPANVVVVVVVATSIVIIVIPANVVITTTSHCNNRACSKRCRRHPSKHRCRNKRHHNKQKGHVDPDNHPMKQRHLICFYLIRSCSIMFYKRPGKISAYCCRGKY